MGPNSSTRTQRRTTSVRRIAERRSSTLLAQRLSQPNVLTIPAQRHWRADDPDPTTIGELTPDQFGKRIVIRSGDFLGTVYGTLLGVAPHVLVHFTTVQLYAKKELTFRNDMEVLVLD